MVFNCAGVNSYDPMRFAGTWKQYSKKAMPQLTRITFHSASLRNFRCPYHAIVMKTLEIVSNSIVRILKFAPRVIPHCPGLPLDGGRLTQVARSKLPLRILHTWTFVPFRSA